MLHLQSLCSRSRFHFIINAGEVVGTHRSCLELRRGRDVAACMTVAYYDGVEASAPASALSGAEASATPRDKAPRRLAPLSAPPSPSSPTAAPPPTGTPPPAAAQASGPAHRRYSSFRAKAPTKASGRDDKTAVVAFASVEFICVEDDDVVAVAFTRRGNLDARVEVDWETRDIDNFAKAPPGWHVQRGTATFEAGEHRKEVEVKVFSDDHWGVEQIDECCITGVRNASDASTVLVGDLRTASIVTLNDEDFPAGVPLSASPRRLLRAFVHHNYNLMRSEARWAIFWNSYPALFFLVNEIVRILLVDYILWPRGASPAAVAASDPRASPAASASAPLASAPSVGGGRGTIWIETVSCRWERTSWPETLYLKKRLGHPGWRK